MELRLRNADVVHASFPIFPQVVEHLHVEVVTVLMLFTAVS